MDWRALFSWLDPRPRVELATTLDAPPPDASFAVEVPPEIREVFTSNGAIAYRISRREALQVPAVMRARNLIAGTLATLPIQTRDKDRNIATPTTLLEQIDPDVANVVTLAQTYEDLLFEGVCWWRIAAFGWHGYPIAAGRLEPSTVHQAPDGRVYVNGRPVGDEELIKFDSPNPALLQHAARAIRTCLRLDQTASRYADEPVPLGYFTPKEGGGDGTLAEITEALDQWETQIAERRWAYVSGGFDAKTLAFDAEQIQLAEQRQHAVLEIARATGVDPEDLGVSTTSRTYANAEQRRLDVLDFTLRPFVSAVEQRLSMRDVLPRGYYAKVNLDAFLRSDTMTRMQTYEIGERVGVTTPEEARALEDRPPLTAAQKRELAPPAPAPPAAAPAAPRQPAVAPSPSNGRTAARAR